MANHTRTVKSNPVQQLCHEFYLCKSKMTSVFISQLQRLKLIVLKNVLSVPFGTSSFIELIYSKQEIKMGKSKK